MNILGKHRNQTAWKLKKNKKQFEASSLTPPRWAKEITEYMYTHVPAPFPPQWAFFRPRNVLPSAGRRHCRQWRHLGTGLMAGWEYPVKSGLRIFVRAIDTRRHWGCCFSAANLHQKPAPENERRVAIECRWPTPVLTDVTRRWNSGSFLATVAAGRV